MPTDGGDEFWIVGPFAFIRKVPEPDYMKSKKNRIAVAVLKEHGFQAGANSSTVVTGAKGDKCVYVKFQHDFFMLWHKSIGFALWSPLSGI